MADRAPPRPFPIFQLEDAIALASAIQDKNAGRPMNRILLADAIGRKAGSSDYRDLLSASFKYGLTTGTEKAKDISLTGLGVRVTRPTSAEDRQLALQEAALAPEIFGKLYRHYDNAKLPSGTFFHNTLERQFGVPRAHVAECEKVLVANGRFAGLVRDVTGSLYVMFDQSVVSTPVPSEVPPPGPPDGSSGMVTTALTPGGSSPPLSSKPPAVESVFIAHGKNRRLLEQVKQVVEFGRFRPIVAEERESTAIPVPEKVITEMHGCQAGIIIVSAEGKVTDGEGKDSYRVNENVLIEIGAATVLYRKKVILLWDKRIPVPSNLHGLYRCEFEGDSLDWETGLKLQRTLTLFLAGDTG